MESKYLNRFKALNHERFPLRGNRLLVEVMPKEEIKSAGGIVLAADNKSFKSTTEQNRGTLAIVLACGNGYIDEETGEEQPCEVQPGSVILCSDMGFKYYSHFPGLNEYTGDSIALTRETEVHIHWPSMEAFQEYKKTLNG